MIARRRRGLLYAVAVAAGCSAGSNEEGPSAMGQSITQGTPDADHPTAVALLSGGVYCSGALLAPRVVVTAGHCVDGIRPESVYFGRAPANDPGVRMAVSDIRLHPQYDPARAAHDLALLLLEAQAPIDVGSRPVLESPVVDADLVGATVRVVGFGDASVTTPSVRQRLAGNSVVVDADSASFVTEAAPSLPCSGDSGGPAFLSIGGEERLLGIVSRGDAACELRARFARLDFELAEFVTPYVVATGEGSVPRSGVLGVPCRDANDCEDRFCARAADRGEVARCSLLCFADDREACPSGYACSPTEVPAMYGCFRDEKVALEDRCSVARVPRERSPSGEPRAYGVIMVCLLHWVRRRLRARRNRHASPS